MPATPPIPIVVLCCLLLAAPQVGAAEHSAQAQLDRVRVAVGDEAITIPASRLSAGGFERPLPGESFGLTAIQGLVCGVVLSFIALILTVGTGSRPRSRR